MKTIAKVKTSTPISDFMEETYFIKSDENYKSWDKLMPVVEKINKTLYVPNTDMMCTLRFLLEGGYKFGEYDKPLSTLPLTLENLFNRVKLMIGSL